MQVEINKASMRPRSIDRGSQLHCRLLPSVHAASMRPRSIDRGRLDATGTGITVLSRFNEAAINRSRKGQRIGQI